MEKGFTLVEILLTVAMLAILATLTIPLGLNFLKGQQLEGSTQEVIQTLRRAQLKSMSMEGDSNFGLYLTNDNYILFKGDVYTPGDPYNEVFSFPEALTVSGLAQVVFTKVEGLANNTGNIILTIDNTSRTIEVNNFGKISLVPNVPEP